MEIIDNVSKTVCADLKTTIQKGSKLSIAAASFSIYAFQALREQLEEIEELRFIFTSSAFTKERSTKEKREFYIPKITSERNLYGTEYEVKLRNELTQKAIARECAQWIKEKVRLRSNSSNQKIQDIFDVSNGSEGATYSFISEFTTSGLGLDKGNFVSNNVIKFPHPEVLQLLDTFNEVWNDRNLLQDVTETVIENISTVYNENPPDYLYFITLYNIFNEFLEDITEDELPRESTGFKESKIWNMLYDFQRDGVLAIINKLEKFNGCILADSVGLGKTFTALAVIKYYEARNRTVLVLCPKKLSDNWNTYKDNYINNPIASDRLNYDVLYHTDLSRTRGFSNGIDLSRINWSNYDLIVIDESHNFRNGGEVYGEDRRENRYNRLLNNVIRKGVKTKVLMLSATPVNNRFTDLRNQMQLAYEGNQDQINDKLNISKPIEDIFKNAQRVFNEWTRSAPEERSTANLLKKLEFDFFEVLDSVTIARSRKHIEKYYDMSSIGKFPERKKPISLRPKLTDLSDAINYNQIFEEISQLNLFVYMPTRFIFQSRREKYIDIDKNINREGREEGVRRLMAINLLKRLESSVYSFKLTLSRVENLIKKTICEIEAFQRGEIATILATEIDDGDQEFDLDDQNTDYFSRGSKVKIDLNDMDVISWKQELSKDAETLELVRLMIEDITPEHDMKLQKLLELIVDKINNPINPGNKKVLVFSAFADTVDYLYKNVSTVIKKDFGLDCAMITGSQDGKTTIPKFISGLNNVLTCFSPISKDKDLLMPNVKADISILIGTDCISEGQNLQDCDFLINYDIHWNPVRIIQRFGRIDRIGSHNPYIQLVNFWPDLTLDEYINLKSRVETRMKISVMTSTGDDDLINPEEKGDLEYRKAQLMRLQEEVVDLEDMSSGISIMDLGLNEFRLDLLEAMKGYSDKGHPPFGMHAIVKASPGLPPGVIFVLKNINSAVNIDKQNQLHPFYLVYVSEEGKLICDHLSPKKMLDDIRLLAKDKTEPYKDLCNEFNRKTKDGKDMHFYSELLQDAVSSIIKVKEGSEIESLFKPGGTSALDSKISGLADFELICFYVVRDGLDK